jgi:cytochrome c oxidase assembly factor CtaG
MASYRQRGNRSLDPAGYAFYAGLAVLTIALVSPIDTEAHRVLWVHMVQHVLLVSAAAPLLAFGRVFEVFGRAFGFGRYPFLWRRRRASVGLAATTAVATIQVVTLLVWHVPTLFDAALRHDVVHALEHLMLLGTATWAWASLLRFNAEHGGVAVLALFIASLPPMVLGVGMTFARTLWYPVYAAHGVNPMADQQLAGVVMWGYGGLAAVGGGVFLFVQWLLRLERDSPGGLPLAVGGSGAAQGVEVPPC